MNVDILADPITIAALFSIAFGLLLYALFVPRNDDTFEPHIKDKAQDSKVMKIIALLGKEIYATMPKTKTSIFEKPYPKTESLLSRAGNPWGITAPEFLFLQVVTGFVGAILGGIAAFGLQNYINIPWYVFVVSFALFGYFIPKIKYMEQAKKRDLEFKKQLPEALDLIIISLSGGNTFSQALRESLPNMEDSVLKKEFQEIVNNMDSSRTLDESLQIFAEKAPNESIRTFVQAIREANELNVPLVEVLRSRAEASREEFFALIHSKTAQLQSKIMMALTPTLMPAVIIVVLAPAAVSLIGTLG